MKKIAFIIRLFQKNKFHGGGEKLFFNLIKRFAAKNYEIDIYCSKSDMDSAEGIRKIVVIDKHYDHLKPETMEDFYNEVKNRLKDENYDYVISENITPPVDITFLQGHSLVNRLKRDKNLLEAFLYNFRNVKKNRMKYHKKWMKEGYRHIFAVSEVLKRDIVENFNIPEDKVSVVYPGVDMPQKTRIDAPVQTFSRNDDVMVFGLAAPGFKIKGGFIFLKALGILKKKGYKFKAKIIYPKFKRNFGVKLLVKFLNIEKNVEFLSFQENINEFYSSIDCLVAPSVEDTFNLAVLEAMANYKPCIVSNNAGASEIIKDRNDLSSSNGFVFNVKKSAVNNLAEKMILLINNSESYAKIAENAFETAKFYSWDEAFKKFEEKLLKL